LNSSSTSTEVGNIALAASFVVLAAALGYRYIGLPPVIIVGGSGLIGLSRLVDFLFEEADTARNHFAVVPLDCGGS